MGFNTEVTAGLYFTPPLVSTKAAFSFPKGASLSISRWGGLVLRAETFQDDLARKLPAEFDQGIGNFKKLIREAVEEVSE